MVVVFSHGIPWDRERERLLKGLKDETKFEYSATIKVNGENKHHRMEAVYNRC